MVNAIRDDNQVTVGLGVSSSDPTATVPIKINPVTGKVLVGLASGSTSVTPASRASRDSNRVPSMMGVSTDDDDVPLNATINSSTGRLIVNTS